MYLLVSYVDFVAYVWVIEALSSADRPLENFDLTLFDLDLHLSSQSLLCKIFQLCFRR